MRPTRLLVTMEVFCLVLSRGTTRRGAAAEGPAGVAAVEPPGWFAGDAHVHRGIGCSRADAKEMLTPAELLEAMQPNRLNVVAVLADMGNGEIRYAEKDLPLISGRDDAASRPGRLLHWDAEWHFDPRGVTFERKAIGGHLILLGLEHGETLFREYTYPVFEWAKKQNAVAGFAHLQYLPEGIPQELDCCAPLELPVEVALGSAAFVMEDVNGSDTAIHAYYRLLNCGFRPGLVASTDYPCNFLEPLGTLLTYVQIPDRQLNYRKWIEAIAQGRTVVSRNGHNEFLDLKVNGTASPGDELRLEGQGTARVELCWSSAKPLKGRVELVRNGTVVATREGSASPGSPLKLETTLDFAESGWLAARRMSQRGHETHTGAVFVTIGGAPVRSSVADADFFARWIDNLIRQTSSGGAWSGFLSKDRDAARDRYRQARAVYERIAAEARSAKRGGP